MAGKSTGVDKVVEEFRAKIADEAVSKYFLVNKIKAVAVKEKSAAGVSWVLLNEVGVFALTSRNIAETRLARARVSVRGD